MGQTELVSTCRRRRSHPGRGAGLCAADGDGRGRIRAADGLYGAGGGAVSLLCPAAAGDGPSAAKGSPGVGGAAPAVAAERRGAADAGGDLRPTSAQKGGEPRRGL